MPVLEWTDDPAANQLIATDPLALLIGFCLDQQVTVEKAFAGPLVLRQRVGTLECSRLAHIEPAAFDQAFARPPAIHRFPIAMARRVQALCALVEREYDGDAARLWETAPTAAELRRRITELPGFGAMKATILGAVLAQHFGVRPRGWREALPSNPTLGDVSTHDQRVEYQRRKRAHKRQLREQERSGG